MSSPEGTGHVSGTDALFDRNWSIIQEAARAAALGDGDAHRRAILRIESEVPVDGRAGIFTTVVLRCWLYKTLGTAPSLEDADRISNQTAEAFVRTTGGDPSLVRALLCTALELEETAPVIGGPGMIYFGSALLGILLNDPDQDLPYLESRLRMFYELRSDAFS